MIPYDGAGGWRDGYARVIDAINDLGPEMVTIGALRATRTAGLRNAAARNGRPTDLFDYLSEKDPSGFKYRLPRERQLELSRFALERLDVGRIVPALCKEDASVWEALGMKFDGGCAACPRAPRSPRSWSPTGPCGACCRPGDRTARKRPAGKAASGGDRPPTLAGPAPRRRRCSMPMLRRMGSAGVPRAADKGLQRQREGESNERRGIVRRRSAYVLRRRRRPSGAAVPARSDRDGESRGHLLGCDRAVSGPGGAVEPGAQAQRRTCSNARWRRVPAWRTARARWSCGYMNLRPP